MDRLSRGAIACSNDALDPVRRTGTGDGRLDGAEELRLSAAGAGPHVDPQPGDLSHAEPVGGSGGLLLEADLCLPPR